MRLQYVASSIQPPDGAVRANGGRLISAEVRNGGSGVVWDRLDAQPEEPSLQDPACPDGKKAFARWVTEVAFPWLRAYVQRVGLEESYEIIAMVDGVYAMQATTNRSYGYLYFSMFEMPAGVVPPVVETPIPPPPAPLAGSVPHTYEADRFYGHRKYPPCGVVGCYENKTAKIHKPVKAAR